MSRYSFTLDETIPHEKELIDFIEQTSKKANIIKYLLHDGLKFTQGVTPLVLQDLKNKSTGNADTDTGNADTDTDTIVTNEDEELDIDEVDGVVF